MDKIKRFDVYEYYDMENGEDVKYQKFEEFESGMFCLYSDYLKLYKRCLQLELELLGGDE